MKEGKRNKDRKEEGITSKPWNHGRIQQSGKCKNEEKRKILFPRLCIRKCFVVVANAVSGFFLHFTVIQTLHFYTTNAFFLSETWWLLTNVVWLNKNF